jgi:outer membrane protein OmpA-like peptidoglycan-associated protein
MKQALKAAKANNEDKANHAATEGLKWLEKANNDTQVSKEILQEVLAIRTRAQKSGAPSVNVDGYRELDKDLQDTSVLIEKGRLESAKKRRPELIEGYSQLELAALKRSMIEIATASIQSAYSQGAKKYAPKTMRHAKEEMDLALSILEADRTQVKKANDHATKAKWLAERAAIITGIIKDIDREDYSQEDVILWYQSQLETVNLPFGTELPFNEENSTVVNNIQQAISKMLDESNLAKIELMKTKDDMAQRLVMSKSEAVRKLAETEDRLKAAETQIAELMAASKEGRTTLRQEYELKLATSSKEREALARANREQKARFEKVQSSFNSKEATVYQQRENILISVHGFKFPTGQSEIDAENFPLMNKLTQTISAFPKSRIEVVGHTDATGNDRFNQALSEERAEKVAKFLKEVGHIPSERLTARGYGETKPVASNETSQGRAANRRIEIIIVNEE